MNAILLLYVLKARCTNVPMLQSDLVKTGNVKNGCAYIILYLRGRILVQVTIYRRLLIGRDGRLDQSEAYDVS